MIRKTEPIIIAHRGESFDAPENTLASINLAWQRNDDAVEVDVHLTKDNRIVVIHDPNTKRITGQNKKIKNSTLTELQTLDFGSWKAEKWKDEKIPTIDEVLQTVPVNKKIIIEIKSGKNILPFLKKVIDNSPLKIKQIEFISFEYSTIVATKKMFPNHIALYLIDLDYTWYTKLFSPSVNNLIKKVKKENLDGLNVWAGKLLTKQFADKVKLAGLLLYVWTVDDPEHAKQLFDWGIDALTTNRAEWMQHQLFDNNK